MPFTAEQIQAEIARRGLNVDQAMQGSIMDQRRGQDIPPSLAGAAFGASALTSADIMARRLGNAAFAGQPFTVDTRERDFLREAFPRAAAIGEAVPGMIGGPSRPALQIPFSAAIGALQSDDPRRGAAFGAGGAIVGQAGGEIAGRIAKAIARGTRRGFRQITGRGADTALDSGIQTTTGRALGSEQGQALETSLSRNPLTSRPFAAKDRANQRLIENRALEFLGAQARTLKEGLEETFQGGIEKIRRAVPDDADIVLSLKQLAKLENKALKGIDIAPDGIFNGQQFRNTRSDLLAAARSPKALTRRKAREAIELLDQAAAAPGTGVDSALYAEGRNQYRRWLVFDQGSAVSNVGQDGLKINAKSLRNNLEKSFGKGLRTGGKRTGDPSVDNLFRIADDLVSVGDLVPNSGTPTAQALSNFTSDVARTGGIGTIAQAGAAELSQTQVGLGIVEALIESAEAARQAGAVAGREAAIRAQRER